MLCTLQFITIHTIEECGTVEVLCYALFSSLQSTLEECGTVEVLCYALLSSLQSTLWRNVGLWRYWTMRSSVHYSPHYGGMWDCGGIVLCTLQFITNHTMEECGTVELLCYALFSSLQSTLWRMRDFRGIMLHFLICIFLLFRLTL